MGVRLLRKILVQHKIVDDKIMLEGEDAAAFAFCLGYGATKTVRYRSRKLLCWKRLVCFLECRLRIKRLLMWVHAWGDLRRLNRREMKPLVHVLFPVSLAGGSHRDLLEAAKKGPVFVEMVKRKCPNCKTYTLRVKCSSCGCETVAENSCPRCGRALKDNSCPTCKTDAVQYQRQPVNFKDLIDDACRSLGYPAPKMLQRR